jgi:hypothetical protein
MKSDESKYTVINGLINSRWKSIYVSGFSDVYSIANDVDLL